MKIPHLKWLIGPWVLFGIGFALNAIVMAANGGQMPVLIPGGDCSLLGERDIIYSCMTHATHLKFLADWIVTPHPVQVASPGDYLERACEGTALPAFVVWMSLMIRDANDKLTR